MNQNQTASKPASVEEPTDEGLHGSFEDWWNDQENGCPTLVLDNDEEFARAVWNAAIKSIENNATRNIQPNEH